MEGLTKRIVVLTAVFGVFGIAQLSAPKMSASNRTEAWMEDNSLSAFDGWNLVPSPENPKQSYKMNEATYQTLNPFGIVSRVFQNRDREYDVVLIASNRRESFHDPRICFTGQGYNIKEEKVVQIPTKTRGNVPATSVIMDGPNGPSIAVYFYRGPDGFAPTTRDLKLGMVFSLLKGKKDVDGVFYRIIPRTSKETLPDVVKFAGDYLDASEPFSKGYF
jgi:hypothetical protein